MKSGKDYRQRTSSLRPRGTDWIKGKTVGWAGWNVKDREGGNRQYK